MNTLNPTNAGSKRVISIMGIQLSEKEDREREEGQQGSWTLPLHAVQR
jgi:hypothetical protein